MRGVLSKVHTPGLLKEAGEIDEEHLSDLSECVCVCVCVVVGGGRAEENVPFGS